MKITIFSTISDCLPTPKKLFGKRERKHYSVIFEPNQHVSRRDPSSSCVQEIASSPSFAKGETRPSGHALGEWALNASIDQLIIGLKRDGELLGKKPMEESLTSLVNQHFQKPRKSKGPFSEGEALAMEPSSVVMSSTEAREAVAKKIQTRLWKLDFTAEEVWSQMKNEEEMWQLCTLFSEQHKFEKDTLIHLWMAKELVKNDDYKRLICDSYFDALMAEGCIIYNNKCFPREESMYKVNAAEMNSFATPLQKLYLRLNASDLQTSKDDIPMELENLSLVCDEVEQSIFNQLIKLNKLKTLLLFPHEEDREFRQTCTSGVIIKIPHAIFMKMKRLQVLDLSGLCIAELPSSIGEAKELRYLDLSYSMIELLPETIDRLERLQTLKLRGCVQLLRLPQGIVKLTSLHHLDINVLGQLSFLPKRMGNLTTLETLSAFIIDTDDGRKINELRYMNNLSGSFCISNMERVSNEIEAEKASLSNKENLKKLELRWNGPIPRLIESKEQQLHYKVLEKLHPPSTLEDLEISGYAGYKFPKWIGDSSILHLIVNVTLVSCVHSKLLPSLGKLPLLQNLHLIDINRVKKIGAEFRGDIEIAFPALKTLTIVGMSRLETWTEVMEEDFPCLSKLIFEQCPKLIALPSLSCLRSLKQLEISQCTKLSYWSNIEFPSSLKTLMVENCPSFKKRYGKSNSKARMKIMHVNNVWIDHEEIINNLNLVSQRL